MNKKIEAAEVLLKEAQSLRRRPRPGELVFYITFEQGKPQGEEQVTGFDIVEATRGKEPSVRLRRLKRWMFTSEIKLLARDSQYDERLEVYWSREPKQAA